MAQAARAEYVLRAFVVLLLEGESLILSLCREEINPLGSTQLIGLVGQLKLKPQSSWGGSSGPDARGHLGIWNLSAQVPLEG